MHDPGWGEYVPLPKEADERLAPTTAAGGPGPPPPTGQRPWWRRGVFLVLVGLVVVGVAGGITLKLLNGAGLAEGSGSRPSQSQVITTSGSAPVTNGQGFTAPPSLSVSSGESSSDPFVAFAASANAICARFMPTLVNDFNSGRPSPSLLQDTKDLIAELTQLGPSPSSGSSWQEGLQDWKQAASFLADMGDPQDWQLNIWAGAHLFRDMGVQACGSYGSIGQ
jgi:hypothetical protein